MGFNLGGMLTGALGGLLSGGPVGAAAGGLMGGLAKSGGSVSTASGDLGNAALQGAETAYNNDQTANEIALMQFQSQMQWQNTWFNEMMDERSQEMGEVNQLREVAMEQRKADNSITKEFIRAIHE